eukprot:1160626-Pelagomonas_calceolata.AAC.14
MVVHGSALGWTSDSPTPQRDPVEPSLPEPCLVDSGSHVLVFACCSSSSAFGSHLFCPVAAAAVEGGKCHQQCWCWTGAGSSLLSNALVALRG